MSRIDDLIQEFGGLTEEEKTAFARAIMPSIAEIFRKDPGKRIQEMMPFCADAMKSWGVDIRTMMKKMMDGMDTGGK